MKIRFGFISWRWWFLGFYIGEAFTDIRIGPCFITIWYHGLPVPAPVAVEGK